MPVPESFQAASLAEFHAKATMLDRSVAPLERGEEAIKITTMATNPVDWKMREHSGIVQQWPTIAGSDAAGEIVALDLELLASRSATESSSRASWTSRTYARLSGIARGLPCWCAKYPVTSRMADEQAASVSLATAAAMAGFYDTSGQRLPAP
jgi:NADPH:quinone reductase-like Zn-dependent oxidoreductase